jgi:Mn-dependent DtxR family transcriptional regulator
MKNGYKYSTVYVDQLSRLGYVYLQKMAMVEETPQGKKAFEEYAASHGV